MASHLLAAVKCSDAVVYCFCISFFATLRYAESIKSIESATICTEVSLGCDGYGNVAILLPDIFCVSH